MLKRLGALLLASLVTASCASLPSLPTPAMGSLSLSLSGLFPAERQVQALQAGTQAKLTVTGTGLAQPLSLVAPVDGQTLSATLTGIPAGPNRVIELESLDAAGQAIPGGRFRTTATIQEGANQALISPITTPRGDVIAKLLAEGSDLAGSLDATRLQERIEAIQRAQRVAHFALINGGAIADALKANGGNLDALSLTDASFVQAARTVTVTVKGLPENLKAEIWVDDPVSPKQTGIGNGSLRVEPVKPGSWNLYGRAGSLRVGPITVPASATSPVVADFSRPVETLTPLPAPRAGAASGMLRIALAGGEADCLVVAGGMVNPGDVFAATTASVLAFDGTTWHALSAPMPVPVSHAAFTVHDGKLWVLGGRTALGQFSDAVQVFDGTTWTTEDPLPAPSMLGSVTVTDQQLVYTSGLRGLYAIDNTLFFQSSPAVLVRARSGDSDWEPMASLAAPRVGAAYATLNGKHYVISGFTSTNAGVQQVLATEVYDPASGTVSAAAPLPTPRFGAMTWVAGGKIVVAGGVTPQGKPLNHVEAYDPVNDRWEILPPLKTPRAHAAAGLLNGKVAIAGGHDSLIYQGSIVPLDTVEALKP